jgi:hypothetical protein
MLRVLVASIIMVAACGQPFWTPPPSLQPSAATPPVPELRPLPAGDWRKAFLGTWSVLFTFDSVRFPVRAKGRTDFVTTPRSDTLNALFHLRDTVTDLDGRHLASSLEFDSMAVPYMAWPPDQKHHTRFRLFSNTRFLRTTILERDGAQVTLNFAVGCRECRAPYNEGCFDCGSPRVQATYWGDSVVGTWRDLNLGMGPFGRFRMVRRVAESDST